MRPIKKPDLPDPYFSIPPSALLLQSFGEYCSVSEQPLPSRHHVWHKRLGVEVSAPVSRTYWQDLLLLSENTFLAQLGKPLPHPFSSSEGHLPGLLYPDEDPLTYPLDGSGPFKYRLQRVVTIFLDEGGRELRRQESKEVIVTGATDVAQETIEFFALNSQFFIASDSVFRIPISVARSGFDRRVRQRTEVWGLAEGFAEALRSIPDTMAQDEDPSASIVAQGRRLAAATGYWSTWAAALANQRIPPERITELLLPPHQGWGVGPGPHNPYPGTNRGVTA